MRITPINTINIYPAFKSKGVTGANNKKSTLNNQSSSKGDIILLNSSLLPQKADPNIFYITEIDPKDRVYDSFTGLRDKTYLLASLDVKMQQAQRENKQLSIAMFDMDDFKSVNELLGYKTGDEFIKQISKNIAKVAEDNNIDAYRFGGEEFVLIFDDDFPDSKKKEIAETITNKTNTDRKIQSYKNLYMRNAQTRLDKALYSTAKVQKISELKTKSDTIKEVVHSLSTEEAKNDPYFTNAMENIDSQINSIYVNLTNECLQKEKDIKTRKMLVSAQSKLSEGKKLSAFEDNSLLEYLYSVYDKAGEVYQTRRWMHYFLQNHGFGITCGIVNFEPAALEYKTPIDIIERTGNVLKNSKNTRKGQVYLENITH